MLRAGRAALVRDEKSRVASAAREVGRQDASQDRGDANLKEQVCAILCPAHLLFFDHPFCDKVVDACFG
jgi:hypothetical protein